MEWRQHGMTFLNLLLDGLNIDLHIWSYEHNSFADAPISWKDKRNKAVSLSAAAPVAILYISFL